MYQQIQLNKIDNEYEGYISKKRVVKCPFCDAGNVIDFEEYITGELHHDHRFGAEVEHDFCCEKHKCCSCGKTFTVEGSINEYPVGVYESEHIEVRREG